MSKTLAKDGYQANESADLSGMILKKMSERSTEGDQAMGRLTALFIGLREFRWRLSRGQTMTEYALILAAIAVACFAVYLATGQDINALVAWNQIDKDLTNAL
jgi:Flp pilus assembly pilin Flp